MSYIGRLTGNFAAERLAQVVRSHVLLQQVEPEGFALDGILLLAQKLKDDEGSGSTLQIGGRFEETLTI